MYTCSTVINRIRKINTRVVLKAEFSICSPNLMLTSVTSYQSQWLSAPGICLCLCGGLWWRNPAWPWVSGTWRPCRSSVWTVRSCASGGSYWKKREQIYIIASYDAVCIKTKVCVRSYMAAFWPCCSLCQSSFRERMVCHAWPQVLLRGL